MKKIISLLAMIISILFMSSCTENENPDIPYIPIVPPLVEPTIKELVSEKLNELSLIEKVAQMIQAERAYITPDQVEQYGIGSILSGGGSHPTSYIDSADVWYDMYADYQESALKSTSEIPIIYGVDAIHGNNNLYGATIFPHNIGLGAANNSDLMYEIGKATAEEMLVTGITWTFAPAVSVVSDISWGRTYEGLSENPLIHQNLVKHMIFGLQENGVSATAKHFVADGGTIGGIDQGNVTVNEQTIRDIHLSPYVQAINAGVDTIMISYSAIDDIKMHGSHYWITEVLKEELEFEGFIISDWNAIHQLPGSYDEQIVTAVNAGVDMLMEPSDWESALSSLYQAVISDNISVERIDDAVSRILTVKYNRGLIDEPFARLDPIDYLYSSIHQDIARQAVRESLVLLKNNEEALPLNKDELIYIAGPASNNVGYLCGGWTTYWLGNTEADIGVGISISQAFSNVLESSSTQLVSSWTEASTVVVVLSEIPYSEGAGDNDQLTLTQGLAHPDNDQALLLAKQAHDAGKKVIGILISGRPLVLGDDINSFDAFVAAWLPGSEGGTGIADVIFGDYDFTGKLSYTWPRDLSQVGFTSTRSDYEESIVMYPFGYGLSYLS
ncbi:MAG: glycoside hydrolase family 3 protein [Acholeplasmataceae bacterium]|nr:glycoside hydrolase family 3 protein [Acholeplasmataceae bacterium]